MIQKEEKEDLVIQECDSKTIKEQLNEVLNRYLFEPINIQTKESMKNDICRFIDDVFQNGKVSDDMKSKYDLKGYIPQNVIIENDEYDTMWVSPNDDDTLELFKDLELL